MIYDLKTIESKQIAKAHKMRLYKVERDRLKSRFFIYVKYPVVNYHGLNLSEARKFVYSDFVARYERLTGRNVLFSIGYNNLCPTIYSSAGKLDKPLYNFCASQFATYQKELHLLDVSFDEEKEILLNQDDYIKYVQQVFLFLYDKKLITLKHGNVVYNESKIFQKGQYYENGGKYFSLNDEPLMCVCKNHFVLKLTTIKKDLQKEIEKLNVSQSVKLSLLDRLCYTNIYEIKCMCSNGEIVRIKMNNPEYICGASYIAINPDYYDIKPFIVFDECGNYDDLIINASTDFIYSGTMAKLPIINMDIPIFISKKFDEAVHVGIPSLSDEEEVLVNYLELDYNSVIDFINDECILVNSGRFNGLSLMEAHEEICSYLVKEQIATLKQEIELDELIISSNIRFGIPVPLHIDLSPATIPVIYNLNHDVKLESGELADRNLVKDFLTDEFVINLLPNAIRLKGETGILDFESIEALDEIGLFRKIDIAYYDNKDYASDLIFSLVFNRLFARYYTFGFDCPIDDIVLTKGILASNQKVMHRDNNNLVSVMDLINKYGSSTIRLYYATMANVNEIISYNEKDLSNAYDMIDKIIKVYYYPIDDNCIELNEFHRKLIDDCEFYADRKDFKKYIETVFEFIKKVHEIKHISRTQARDLLIILSVIIPSLTEQIKEDVLNLKDPLYYYSFPL